MTTLYALFAPNGEQLGLFSELKNAIAFAIAYSKEFKTIYTIKLIKA